MKKQIQSIVIIKTEYGYTATMRFTNKKLDRIISSNKKDSLYISIEDYVKSVVRG